MAKSQKGRQKLYAHRAAKKAAEAKKGLVQIPGTDIMGKPLGHTVAKPPSQTVLEQRVSPTKVPKPRYSKVGAKRHIGVESGRYTLQYGKLTRSQAKRKTTLLAKQGFGRDVKGDLEQGQNLKNGIEGMARRVNLDEERYQRIMEMDPDKLDAMYKSNDLIFDVFFEYGGIETDPETGAYVTDGSKDADFDFLIEQYNKLFPESAV